MAIDVNDLPVEDFSLDASTLPVEDFLLPVSQPIDSTTLPIEDFSLSTPPVEPAIAETTAVPLGEPIESTAKTPEELFNLTAKPVEPEKERGFIGNVVEAWKRGNTQGILDYMSYEALTGKRDLKEVEKIRKEYREKFSKDPIEANNYLSKSVMALSGMLPVMLKGLVEGQAGGAGGALGGGAAGWIGGPPGAAAGAGIGYTVGTAAGSAEYYRRIGAGSTFGELLDKGINEKTASKLAHIVSVPYALIEQSQVTKAIPGADKALKKIIGDNLLKIVGKFAAKKGAEIAEESFEEGVQGALVQTAEEVGKYIEGESEGLGESAKNVALRFVNDFKESVGPMALLMSPKIARGAIDIGISAKAKGAKVTPEITPEPQKQVVEPKKVEPIPEVVEETKLAPIEKGAAKLPKVIVKPKSIEKSSEDVLNTIQSHKDGENFYWGIRIHPEDIKKMPKIGENLEPSRIWKKHEDSDNYEVVTEEPSEGTSVISIDNIKNLDDIKQSLKIAMGETPSGYYPGENILLVKSDESLPLEDWNTDFKESVLANPEVVKVFKRNRELKTFEVVEPTPKKPKVEKKPDVAPKKTKGAIVSNEGDGLVELFHGTDKEGFSAIKNEKTINSPVYLTPRKEVAEDFAGGEETVISVKIPKEELKIDLDLPGGRLLDVEDANEYLDKDYTIDDYIDEGYSVGTEKTVFLEKPELTPEEKGFVEKVRPEVTVQKPKKVEKPKIEKSKIEKPKKVKPVVEEKKSKINKDGEVILKPTKKRPPPPKREGPPPVKTINPKTQKPITDPEQDVRSFQQVVNRPEVDSEILPETVKEKFIRKMQDKANRIKTVQDVIAPELSDDVNTYVRQDLMSGRVEDGLEKFRDNEVKPFEKKMTGFKTELENFEEYAYAKHAEEANIHVKKIRFNTSGEALGIKETEALNETDKLKEAWDELGGEKANYQRRLKVENLTDTEKKKLNEKIVGVDKKMENINNKIGKMNAQLKKMGVKVEEYKDVTESGSGMPTDEANEILKKVEASGKLKQYESLHKDIRNMINKTAKIRLDGGLIDQKEYDRLTGYYKHYVPLQGIGEEVKEKRKLLGVGKRGGGRDIRGPEHKRRLGRRSKASKILAHAMLDRNKAIARAEENRVRQTFLRFVQQNPNKDLWEVDEVVYKPIFNKSTGQVENRQAREFDLTEEERAQRLGVKVDGKGFEITIKDPILARAMKNLGADKKGKVIQAFAAFNRYLALVNTAYSLGFIPTNFARDVQTMAINMTAEESLKTTKNILKDVPAAIIGIGKAELVGGKETKWTKYYTEFKKVGGKIGFYGLKDADRLQKDIMNEIFLMKGGLKTQPVRVFKAVGKFVMGANAAVESGTRLATYVNMRKIGYSEEKSASIAKNITVNFNKQGEMGAYFNALYVFANAQIQGTARLLQTLTSKKSRGRAAVLVSGISVGSFAIAQLARVMGGQDDDDVYYYDKIPPWVRENHIVIMRPGEKSLGKDGFLESIHYVKIPVPYGFNIFHAVGQAVDVSLYDPDDGPTKGAKMVASSVGNAFNPLGSASTLWQTITPTAFRWAADLGLNKNFFGAPIERKQADYEVEKAKSELYFKSTSETSKQISKGLNLMSGGETHEPGFINVSPDAIDHVAEFLTGGAGRTINQTVSLAAKLGTKKPITVREIPVARRFLGEIPEYEDISRLYKNTDKIRAVRKQFETFLVVDKKKAIEYRREHKGLLWFTDKRKDAEGKSQKTVLKTFEKEMKYLKNRRDELEAAGKDVEKINEVLLNKTKKFNKVFTQKKKL